MDGGTVAAIVIGVVWVSVAIAATLLQPYVKEDDGEWAPGAHKAVLPKQREAEEARDVRPSRATRTG